MTFSHMKYSLEISDNTGTGCGQYPIVNFGHLMISLEWMKLDISNLVFCILILSISVCMIEYHSKGCVQGHVTS